MVLTNNIDNPTTPEEETSPDHAMRDSPALAQPPSSFPVRDTNDGSDEDDDSNAGSPPTSQVSVNSVPPTLVASLLNKAAPSLYDLTPVMRNTGLETLQHHASHHSSSAIDANTVAASVTPADDTHEAEEESNYILRSSGSSNSSAHVQEHLSLPMDNAHATVSSGIPPKIRLAGRSHSVACSSASKVYPPQAQAPPSSSLRPIPLPHRQKYFSFSGRDEYNDAVNGDSSEEDPSNGIAPYQPQRENAMEELPPEEVLGQIFAARRRQSSDYSQGESTPSKTHHQQHRLEVYHRSASMGSNRSMDAPSIHLAHQLGTDTASITTHTTLNTLGEELDDELDALMISQSSWAEKSLRDSAQQPPVIVEGGFMMLEERSPTETTEEGNTIMAIDGRLQREQAALEWLNSLPSQQIAEAASSKFLRSPVQSPARKNGTATAVP